MSFYNLNVLSESPLTMTSRHECRLFNWYHFASKRYDEWLLLFKDASGKRVVARFGNSCCASLFPKKKLNKFKNGTRSILRSSFAGAPKKTQRVAWSGPHATWRFNEARIVWQAVVLVCFQLFAIYVSVCEKPQLIEDSLSQFPLIVQMKT